MENKYTSRERFLLWCLAVVSLFGLNLAFVYGLFFQPTLITAALTNPLSLAFIVEAFLLMATFAYFLSKWGKSRLHWGWFVFLSLFGGMAFAVPVVLLWPFKKSDKAQLFIPEGYGTLFPYLFANRAAEYIGFLKTAFGAIELGRTLGKDGMIANSRIKIGTTCFMVSEATQEMKATQCTFYLYVEDADASFTKAVSNGCTVLYEPKDMPYGDRQSGVVDPAGNVWWVSKRLSSEPYDE